MRNRTVWIAVAIVVAAAAAGGIVWGIGQNSGSPSGGTTGGLPRTSLESLDPISAVSSSCTIFTTC